MEKKPIEEELTREGKDNFRNNQGRRRRNRVRKIRSKEVNR